MSNFDNASASPGTQQVHTRWFLIVGVVTVFLLGAVLIITTDSSGRQSVFSWLYSFPVDLIIAGFLTIEALRLVRVGLSTPRLTLGPRGITDHSTNRGLMLWSDFQRVSTSQGSYSRPKPPVLKLHATAEVCWHYNQRLPTWQRFPHARMFRRRSIPIKVLGIDCEVAWLEDEVARRISQRSPG